MVQQLFYNFGIDEPFIAVLLASRGASHILQVHVAMNTYHGIDIYERILYILILDMHAWALQATFFIIVGGRAGC